MWLLIYAVLSKCLINWKQQSLTLAHFASLWNQTIALIDFLWYAAFFKNRFQERFAVI